MSCFKNFILPAHCLLMCGRAWEGEERRASLALSSGKASATRTAARASKPFACGVYKQTPGLAPYRHASHRIVYEEALRAHNKSSHRDTEAQRRRMTESRTIL